MHGPQFSRGFAALKVWVSLLAHGRAAYGRRIAHDAALARYLGDLVSAHPDFELMCEPRLSICCFRYFGLRACIVNFRTEADDVERLLAVATELGAQAVGRPGTEMPDS